MKLVSNVSDEIRYHDFLYMKKELIIKYQTSQALATCLWVRTVLSHKPSCLLESSMEFSFPFIFPSKIFSLSDV